VEEAKKGAGDFKGLFLQTEVLMARLDKAYDTMNASAAGLSKTTATFLDSQSDLLRHELGAGVNTDAGAAKAWVKAPEEAGKAPTGGLLQRFEKVGLITSITERMNKVRIAAWKGQAQRDPAIAKGAMA
jgi:hypothetical protein